MVSLEKSQHRAAYDDTVVNKLISKAHDNDQRREQGGVGGRQDVRDLVKTKGANAPRPQTAKARRAAKDATAKAKAAEKKLNDQLTKDAEDPRADLRTS